MLFNYFTIESPRNYRHVIMEEAPVTEYGRIGFSIKNIKKYFKCKDFEIEKSLVDNYRMNALELQRLRVNMKKFNCLNDNLSHEDIEGLVGN